MIKLNQSNIYKDIYDNISNNYEKENYDPHIVLKTIKLLDSQGVFEKNYTELLYKKVISDVISKTINKVFLDCLKKNNNKLISKMFSNI